MVLLDINVLINAHRLDAPRHHEFQQWLEREISSGRPYSVPSLVRSGFIRIITHYKIFQNPTSPETAIRFMESLRENENHVEISPGIRHWKIFMDLCLALEAKGNLVADAYLAAMAIESGGEWITADRDFARFPGVKWRHPLDAPYGPEGRSGREAQESRSSYRVKKHLTRKK